jgi:hypothetical protein
MGAAGGSYAMRIRAVYDDGAVEKGEIASSLRSSQ